MPRRREYVPIATIDRNAVFGDTNAACLALAKQDAVLAHALDAIGAPHIRRRPGGFAALFRIIVEQQVSVASAQAIWKRCLAGVKPLTPGAAIAAGEDGLRACGLSGPKIRYVLALGDVMERGDFDPDEIARMSDDDALAALQALKGIGPWTAAIYLLFCEGRIDVWPAGDVALLAAWRDARIGAGKARGPQPAMAGFDARAARWAPRRGLAAHILWTYYAHTRGRTPI